MDREVLERLAIDRTLGELPGDTVELLDAYLQVDRQARMIARDIEGTVSIARTALADKAPSSIPPFPLARYQAAEQWQRRVRRLTVGGAMVACVLVGLGLGRLTEFRPIAATPSSVNNDASLQVMPVAPVDSSAELVRSDSDSQSFWSIERIRREYERAEKQAIRRPPMTRPINYFGSAQSS
jgi:hypothetical protein